MLRGRATERLRGAQNPKQDAISESRPGVHVLLYLLRDLCSALHGSLDGRVVWRRVDACICMTKSLCCPPETLTTLLIGYTPL